MLIQERVQQHLLSLGFPEVLVLPFSERFVRWVRESGLEWTASRLKSLREYHLSLLSGLNPKHPVGWATRKTRRRVVFKDPLVQYVFDLPSSGKPVKKKEAFLRLYQVLRLGNASPRQIQKFRLAVEAPYNGSQEALDHALTAVEKGLQHLVHRIDKDQVAGVPFVPLRLMPPSEMKRAPVFDRDSLLVTKRPKMFTVSRNHAFARGFTDLFAYDHDWQVIWRTYPYDVSRCMVGEGEYIPIRTSRRSEQMDLPLGRIGFIQEGGCKLRTVANPLLAVQALGEPLKRKLEFITKRIPVIGTFDQSSSHDTIVRWVSVGREVHSYDLTSFTDRFPYKLQERVLRLLQQWGYITQFDVDVFNTVVRKGWWMPRSTDEVRWSVGQPLGFGPSFHLATLTHAALIRGLGGRDYCVVGDDVAIADVSTAHQYADLIKSLGVEVSGTKSIISREHAEFCGKLITRTGITPSIKVSLLSGASQLVDNMRFYGTRALRYLTSQRERRWVWKVFLPEDLGGLGWSFPGESYAEYISALRTDPIALHRLRADLMDFLGRPGAAWGTALEWVSTFDDVNNLGSSGRPVPDGLSPKGVSGIAATTFLTHGRDSPSTYRMDNTYRLLVDRMTSEELVKHSRLPLQVKFLYFNKWGFIDPREKESNLPIPDLMENEGNGNSHQLRFTNFFNPSVIRPEREWNAKSKEEDQST